MNRLKKDNTEKWIVGIAALFFFASVFLIVQDSILYSFLGAGTSGLRSLASVSLSVNDVRRRLEKDYAFLPLRKDQKVFNGDSVFIGGNSNAEILFQTGSTITLEAGSLVVIQANAKGPKIDLKKGSVVGHLSKNENLTLDQNGKTSELSGSDATIAIKSSKDGTSEISVLNGSVSYKKDQGPAVAIEKNQHVEIDAKGQSSKPQSYGVELLAPLAGSKVWVTHGGKITFCWKSDAKAISIAEPLSFEVSRDKDFGSLLYNRKIPGEGSIDYNPPLAAPVYWRVTGKVGTQSYNSPVFQTIALEEKSLIPTSPASHQKIAMEIVSANREGKQSVNLIWTSADAVQSSAQYQVQIFSDPAFQKQVLDEKTDQLSFKTPELKGGHYFWKVKVVDSTRPNTLWSEVQDFELVERHNAEVPKIRDQAFQYDSHKNLTPTSSGREIQWDKAAHAAQYEIQSSLSKNFETNLGSFKTTAPHLAVPKSWIPDQNGKIFARVRSISDSETVTDYSSVVELSFAVQPKPIDPPNGISPRAGQRIEFSDSQGSEDQKPTPPTLTWTQVARAKTYEVQTASDNQFKKNLESSEEKKQTFSIKDIEPGKIYWRVRAKNDVSTSDWAGPYSFVWAKHGEGGDKLPPPVDFSPTASKPLSAPMLIAPLGRIRPKALVKQEFQWSPIDGAQGYEVTLTHKVERYLFEGRAPSSTIEGQVFKTQDNHLSVELPETGTYTWKVRALASINTPKADSLSNYSEANFEVLRPEFDRKRPGFVALSTMFAPYTYHVTSSLYNVDGAASSNAVNTRLNGEYWFSDKWGAGIMAETTNFSLDGNTFYRSAAEVSGKFSFPFKGDNGYFFSTSLGFETRQYFEITPSTLSQFWTVGPTLAVEFRKVFSEQLSLGIKAHYFFPISALGLANSQGLTSDASYRNFSIGAQGFYWFHPHFGVGLGGFLELRSISYQPTAPLTPGVDQIYTDGFYLYGSLVYRFGK